MHTILIAGAALVGLPILLHLIMKQEPKRLSFPAFRFLKQRLKTNQRKMRLRHIILLALRMLLIALFCLALYQPSFKSESLNISGEGPIATVIVIDTTPSMGYVANGSSRLDEAKRRALELIEQLPDKSPVAVIDTGDVNAGSWVDKTAAKRRIEELRETRGGQPLGAAVAAAYQLHAKVDQEVDASESMPKLVAIFSDRTVASWDPARTEDLLKLRDLVPDPKPDHVLFDFGVDQATNVAILDAVMRPQVIPADRPASVTVTVGAVGQSGRTVEVTVVAKIAGTDKNGKAVEQVRSVGVPNGGTGTVRFEFRDLKPGLNQVTFSLKTADNQQYDNERYITFKVGEARRILTIADEEKIASFWQAAHVVRGEFSCIVVTPDRVQVEGGQTVVKFAPDPKKPAELVTADIRTFEAVCLLAVRDPSFPAGSSLWDKLRPYARTGGKLIVVPGSRGFTELSAYNDSAADLMPGKLVKVVETWRLDPPPPEQTASDWPDPRKGENGVIWMLDEDALRHPLLKPIEAWQQQAKGQLDFVANPRTARRYWEVAPDPEATVIVRYNDAAEPKARRPAVLERPVRDPNDENKIKGKVVLVTTRLDLRNDKEEWNDYWKLDTSWYAVFPYLLVRHLSGDVADANFNFITGATVTVPLPRGLLKPESVIAFTGPGITGNKAIIRPQATQIEVRVGPQDSALPGNFVLSTEQDGATVWRDGFSTNVPLEEINLEKVPVEALEPVLGKDRVVPVDRTVNLRDVTDVTFGHPIDLFPWLLLAVFALFVLEGLIANRFYRKAAPKAG